MTLAIYQVDAFASELFKGNPAAVVPLANEWLSDVIMQNIALENNLSETVFFIFNDGQYHIRWFTPQAEVDLCGHATLATAYVLKNCLGFKGSTVDFMSKSGVLSVAFKNDWIYLNFPALSFTEMTDITTLNQNFNYNAQEAYISKDDVMLVYANESEIIDLKPDLSKLATFPARGFICTAKSENPPYDFVSRFFGPAVGVNEDPVTGSAHTKLIPYWSHKLNKKTLIAYQASQRGGVLHCENLKDRVLIGGQGVLFLKGEIFI